MLDDCDVVPEVVVAIPWGGVPVGRRVADAFGVPLVVLSVKKVGTPSNPELVVGAVTDGGRPVLRVVPAGRRRDGSGVARGWPP